MFPAATAAAAAGAPMGTDQRHAFLAQSRAVAALQARQLVFDHAHGLLRSTTARAKDTRAMAETLAPDTADVDPGLLDLVQALRALEIELHSVADRYGAVLHAIAAGSGAFSAALFVNHGAAPATPRMSPRDTTVALTEFPFAAVSAAVSAANPQATIAARPTHDTVVGHSLDPLAAAPLSPAPISDTHAPLPLVGPARETAPALRTAPDVPDAARHACHAAGATGSVAGALAPAHAVVHGILVEVPAPIAPARRAASAVPEDAPCPRRLCVRRDPDPTRRDGAVGGPGG
ncbi:hypothetical protein AMAG_17414 [Allomyces macrogynus ATCC 38327]|uniref:Uncharacterized protein n=1 Tax=Allomyces macrogynus (strain ATCC 38327) TaxID=578462 RepID=A0A0L0TEQ4_ALLM3|nr:hypothetical protein AMAG_17414 [Allomyces macrogynus ATCC 38327]|eukprot:KNE73227.1 hypothetical protein AMAG_17414 [Allomyces macrogynus ATCC 38327]